MMRVGKPWMVSLLLLTGCKAPVAGEQRSLLRNQALDGLKRGTGYEDLPTVRAQAVEALQVAAPTEGLSWIRKALGDAHAGVRFAACTALGVLRDKTALPLIEKCLSDSDENVRVAAIFALHRMGDTRFSNRFPELLLEHRDFAVRRNTAMLLGRLGEKGAVALLARAMSSDDLGLRIAALESMAVLGGKEAVQQLKFMAHSGAGAEETLAILALAETRDPNLADLYRFKLKSGKFLETRLASAKALGYVRQVDGYDTALRSLRYSSPASDAADDPPENQLMRVKQLASSALAAIGNPEALLPLGELMHEDPDPRVQVAAARAILELTGSAERRGTPFGRDTARH